MQFSPPSLQFKFNPLIPKSDWNLISPYNITTESHTCHENKGNDHQLKKLFIVRQILLVSTLVNVLKTVWRI